MFDVVATISDTSRFTVLLFAFTLMRANGTRSDCYIVIYTVADLCVGCVCTLYYIRTY